MAVTRESDATYFIPTENEWYKAAYHKNDGVTGNYPSVSSRPRFSQSTSEARFCVPMPGAVF